MSLKAWYQVTRPALTLLGALASVALLKWTGQLGDYPRSLLIVLLVFTANLDWNIYAELRDRKLDRIANPQRPLPSGQLSNVTVYQVWAVMLIISLTVNFILIVFYGPVYFIGLLGHWAAFTYVGGRKDLIGNFLMGVTYGVAAFVSLYPSYLLFSLAFLLWSTGYNIIQQFQKFEGERAVGIKTCPTQFSAESMFVLVQLLFLGALFIYVQLYLETRYIPLLIIMASNELTALSGISILKEELKRKCEILRKVQKHALIIGFGAMLLL